MYIWPKEYIYYIAGLLDGEGSFTSSQKHSYMELSLTDEDLILKCKEYLQIGNVRGPYQRAQNRKPFWVWHVAKTKDLARLVLAIYPLMSSRRQEQIEKMYEHMSKTSKTMNVVPCEICGVFCQKRGTGRGGKRTRFYCSDKCKNAIYNRRKYREDEIEFVLDELNYIGWVPPKKEKTI